MGLQTTSTSGQDVVNSLIHAIADDAEEDISTQLRYTDWGMSNYELDISDEQLQGLSGPGVGVLTVEGQAYGSNEKYRDYPKGFTLRKYTSTLEITEEVDHWLAKRLASNPTKAMNDLKSLISNGLNSVIYNVNYDAAQMFFLSTGTTFFSGGDGVALGSGSHPIRKTGATQSNLFSDTHRAFSGDNLIEAIRRMNRFKGMNDVQMRRSRRYRVICTIENEEDVWKTLNSLFGPNNPNLGKNAASAEAYRARGIEIDHVACEYIPSSDAYKNFWAVVDLDRAAERFVMGVGWLPRLNREEDDTRKGTRFQTCSTLVGPNARGWQFILPSLGTGAAV